MEGPRSTSSKLGNSTAIACSGGPSRVRFVASPAGTLERGNISLARIKPVPSLEWCGIEGNGDHSVPHAKRKIMRRHTHENMRKPEKHEQDSCTQNGTYTCNTCLGILNVSREGVCSVYNEERVALLSKALQISRELCRWDAQTDCGNGGRANDKLAAKVTTRHNEANGTRILTAPAEGKNQHCTSLWNHRTKACAACVS